LARSFAAEGFFFFLDEKQKIKSAKRLLCRTWPLPRKPGRPRAGIFCPTAFTLGHRFSKTSYALATLKATIVLPAFGRSCFADGEKKRNP
jgi:hypothetical protein